MKAIIMAGGQGTRLRPLTCSVPKPLAPLCGRPVVHYILDLLNNHGFDEAVFTLGYKGEQIERLFESGRYGGIKLDFSREDVPLGTAGCVRQAAYGAKEPFLVISGDALCNFDLTQSFIFHRNMNAAATIITKRVDDPREYGLVISETGKPAEGSPGAKVLGFSEKPSYLGCLSDVANTGVYILSPEVLELIPKGQPCDFARDVFPEMLKRGMPLFSYEESGYWCDIGDFSTYRRSQFDIMNGENCFGENVSVGENSHITSSIIGNNVTVGNNVKIRDSVVLDGVFISDGATVNGAIICRGAKLQHSVSVFEDAVIGENCLIGREAIVNSGVKIWNEKSVPPGSNVTCNVKYGAKIGIELTDSGICGETNTEITPGVCVSLGAALATVSGKIALCCEGNNASTAMKHAIIAGASGAGAEIFDIGCTTLPQLAYASQTLNCGIIARVKCVSFTHIEILCGAGLPLTRQQERRLEAAMTRGEYKSADRCGFGTVHAVTGFENIYNSMLYRHADFVSNYRVKINCDNKSLVPVFDAVSGSKGELLIITLIDGGSKAEIYTQSNIKVDYDQLILLAAARLMQGGFDVALPNEFAACADFLADSYGRKVCRFFRCSNDDSDAPARELAAGQLFLRDGAILALNVLEYLARNNLTIENAVKSIPQFACESREVEINCPPQRIISWLCTSGATGRGEGVLVGKNRGSVLVRSSKRGDSLVLLAESLSSETAAELCDSTENLIKKLMNKNDDNT
jgi:mannose-1-phosphate guanylyltransferase/phosphomannomutase